MEEGTRSRLLKWRRSRLDVSWTEAPLLFLALKTMSVLVHPVGSLPGHMKECSQENRQSTFQSTSAKTMGWTDSQGRLPNDLWMSQPLPHLSGSASISADAQADQIWCGNEARAQWRRSVAR